MIYEMTDIHIQPGQHAAFEAAIQHAAQTIITQAKGFIRYSVRRAVETPEHYLLQIEWETLEDHMVGFRQSSAFTAWRALISPYFASAPQTTHYAQTCSS